MLCKDTVQSRCQPETVICKSTKVHGSKHYRVRLAKTNYLTSIEAMHRHLMSRRALILLGAALETSRLAHLVVASPGSADRRVGGSGSPGGAHVNGAATLVTVGTGLVVSSARRTSAFLASLLLGSALILLGAALETSRLAHLVVASSGSADRRVGGSGSPRGAHVNGAAALVTVGTDLVVSGARRTSALLAAFLLGGALILLGAALKARSLAHLVVPRAGGTHGGIGWGGGPRRAHVDGRAALVAVGAGLVVAGAGRADGGVVVGRGRDCRGGESDDGGGDGGGQHFDNGYFGWEKDD